MTPTFARTASLGSAHPHARRTGSAMGSFGERLQREREMRGISLEEIAEATKIGTRSLRALEQEDFSKLPGGIFNRGFVRAYARYLGIDEEQAVNEFRAVCGEPEQPLPNPVERKREEIPVMRESSSRKWVVLAVLLLAAGGAASWKMGWLNRSTASDTPPPASAAPAVPVSNVAPPASSSPLPSVAAAPSSPGPGQSHPASAASPAGPQGSVVRPVSTAQPAGPPSTAAASPPVTADTPFTLDIKAAEDSWVEITVDGKMVAREMMKAHGERSFSADRQIVVHCGNSGALEFAHNGRPVAVASGPGKSRTFTFTPEGLQP